ncbi:MAG TPA: STAS domain-containing protein [Candidatus Nanopelagicales bacterium]|nr:STAS domain-containing protein [Candidatus Nanopelagicales bacterium]
MTDRTTPEPGPDADVFHCSLEGEIDFACRDELTLVARTFAASPCRRAEIDVTGVTFVDSTALAMLLGMLRTAEDRGGSVVLVGPGRQLVRLLTIAGVAPLFGVTGPAEV